MHFVAAWLLLLGACQRQEAKVLERVEAGVALAEPSSRALSPEATNTQARDDLPGAPAEKRKKLCDRSYAAGEGALIPWPPPGAVNAGHGPFWVNLWAAWCKPCVEEIPRLRAWAGAGAFSLYLVSLDDDRREWLAGAEKLALVTDERSVWLSPGKARSAWLKPLGFLDVPNLPGQALIDKDHRLRCFRAGAVEDEERDAFLSLLGQL